MGELFTGGVVRTTRAAWRHGEVACPGCGLPVDAQHDIVEELRTITSSEPTGMLVTHLRCGTPVPYRVRYERAWTGERSAGRVVLIVGLRVSEGEPVLG